LEASLDGVLVRLRRDTPAEGFTAVEADLHVRVVPAAECDAVVVVTTTGIWRGQPCQVHDERGDDLLVEHTGGSWVDARSAGFDRVARGVWRRWVPRDEVRGLREDTVLLELAGPHPG
jgi:hypothetical protein